MAEESVLRTSLRPGLFKAVAYNASHRYNDVALFEIGHTYAPAEEPLPDEREVLGVAVAGREGPAAVPVLQEVVAALGLGDRVQLAAPGADAAGALAGMHPGRSSVVTVDGRPIGVVGEVDPGVLEAYDIPGRVAWVEVDLTVLLDLEPAIPQWEPVSRYPSSDIDLAFVVDDDVTAEDLPPPSRGPPAPSWSTSTSSTSTADRGSRPANAAWPSASACRRRITRSPMPRWPPSATPSSPRPAAKGATLRA